MAVAMAFGPEAGLELVDGLRDEPALRGYHLVASVRGDLLSRLGRHAEAAAEFRRAAGLAPGDRQRAVLEDRSAASRSCAEEYDLDPNSIEHEVRR
jgi:predicted RNA polymerase sigma factor